MKKTAILGAGSWGTALAALWASDGRPITLWGHDRQRVTRLQNSRVNALYLPGVTLAENILVTFKIEDCLDADLIVFATPSTALRSVAQELAGMSGNGVLLSCTKGLEHRSGRRMSEILLEMFPQNSVAVLSGPNLAIEVSRGLPTATVIGCTDEKVATKLQAFLGRELFRIYTSTDLLSIELGGALKNVFAIAAGIGDGLGFGDNTKAALVTRALAELLRIGTAMGGKAQTFYGLSGVGDLIATSFSQHSRNRTLGERLGRGENLSKIQTDMQMVAEGVPTTESAYASARRLGVVSPIIDQVYLVLYQDKPVAEAMHDLLRREPKPERI